MAKAAQNLSLVQLGVYHTQGRVALIYIKLRVDFCRAAPGGRAEYYRSGHKGRPDKFIPIGKGWGIPS